MTLWNVPGNLNQIGQSISKAFTKLANLRAKEDRLTSNFEATNRPRLKKHRKAPTLAGGRQSGSVLTCWIYDQQLEIGASEWVIATSILPWSVIFNRLKTFHGFWSWLVKSWNLCRSENIILSATEMETSFHHENHGYGRVNGNTKSSKLLKATDQWGHRRVDSGAKLLATTCSDIIGQQVVCCCVLLQVGTVVQSPPTLCQRWLNCRIELRG